MKSLLSALVLALSAINALALDYNNKISYQGKLINGTNLVSGIATNVFRLYTLSAGGSLLFTQTQTVTVVDGFYSALIGDDTITPSLTDALTNFAVYIEVTINGTTLSPRERIYQAAYALTAVRKTGDTMTGPLSIEVGTGSNLVITTSGSNISIGAMANGSSAGVAIGSHAYASSTSVGIGPAAATDHSVAIGEMACGVTYSVAIGLGSSADTYGAGVGNSANGDQYGAAVGNLADGNQNGVAIGAGANGNNSGAAIGRNAQALGAGVGVGNAANGSNLGVALGNGANAAQTNIAIGWGAKANSGSGRIAIGVATTNESDDSVVIRGTLYLDGATGIYSRSTFGSGAWAARGASDTNAVRKTGDTMTGMLSITNALRLSKDEARDVSTRHMLMIGGGEDVEIGAGANAYENGAAVGYLANGYYYGTAAGYTANGRNYGAALGFMATGHTFGTAVGSQSFATNRGTAAGYIANGSDYGSALGYSASGYNYGAAVGSGAGGRDHGAALGSAASGYNYGVAVGDSSAASDHGVAVGNGASGAGYGVAVGYNAYGYGNSVALGNTAKAQGSNIAIGVMAYADNNWNITAIGQWVSNNVANSARLRGTLYLDGATSILYRTSFGTGPWSNLLSTAEVDPRWSAASNGMQSQIDAKLGTSVWATAGSTTNYVRRDGDTMTGVLTVQTNMAVAYNADRGLGPQGMLTIGGGGNVEIGPSANGYMTGTAVGSGANAYNMGAAVGYGTDARSGAALGYLANGVQGVAVGNSANGFNGVAIGPLAYANGNYRTALGIGASNSVDNTALVRGTLYLDGATGILYRASFGSGAWTALASISATNFVQKTGDTMTGTLKINSTGNGLIINSDGTNVMIGAFANGNNFGTAVGNEANGYGSGAALGSLANGYLHSVAAGYAATGRNYSVAIGENAESTNHGVAIGNVANGDNYGTAIGAGANAYEYGTALGYGAIGRNYGVAVGNNADSARTNIAIGVAANALLGTERTAIGHNVTNGIDNSAAVRGTLYLDGGTGIVYRSTFGTGNWTNYPEFTVVNVVTGLLKQTHTTNGTAFVTNYVLQTLPVKVLK